MVKNIEIVSMFAIWKYYHIGNKILFFAVETMRPRFHLKTFVLKNKLKWIMNLLTHKC